MPVLMRENTMIGNLAIKPSERESVSVTGDGEKTIRDLMYELAQKIDVSKVNIDSYIDFMGFMYFRLNSITNYSTNSNPFFILNFQRSDITQSNAIKFYDVQLANETKTSCKWREKDINYTLDPSSVSVGESSSDSQVLPSGWGFILYY